MKDDLKPKAYIIEYELNNKVGMVAVIAGSREQAEEIAKGKFETFFILDEVEVIYAD